MTKFLPYPVIAGLTLILCLIIAALIRSSDYDNVIAARNIEASYHVLLTSRALGENPASDHFYLPTVTLGGAANAHVPWGATVATKSGDYVYTSFAPPAFLVIHALDQLRPGPLELHDLAWINTGLGALQALLLALLAYQVARFVNAGRQTAALSVVFAVLIAIFSREALQSYGVIYWAHSSYQIVLITGLLLSFALLRSDGRGGGLLRGALLLCVFIGAWMEWTGYVFGGGLAVVLFVLNRIEGRRSRYPFAVAGMLVLAGLVTIGHYAFAVGLEDTLRAFYGRFFARSIGHSEGFGALGAGYILSYGLFLVAVMLGGAWVLLAGFRGGLHRQAPGRGRALAALIVLAVLPLTENILMMQHATEFTFDRLKFIVPAVIVLVVAMAMAGIVLRAGLCVVLVVASLGGVYTYRSDLAAYAWFDPVDRDNRALIAELDSVTDGACTRYATNTGVRGYMNLLVGRSVTEWFHNRAPERIAQIFEDPTVCSFVLLTGTDGAVDMPRLVAATVFQRDGTAVNYRLQDAAVLEEPQP